VKTTRQIVLMVQPFLKQGRLWNHVLVSQGFSVVWETANLDWDNYLQKFQESYQQLPALLLVEIGKGGAKSLNEFCRWFRDWYPQIKIIFIDSAQAAIRPTIRQKILSHGAQDLLPGFLHDHDLEKSVTNNIRSVLAISRHHPLQTISLLDALQPTPHLWGDSPLILLSRSNLTDDLESGLDLERSCNLLTFGVRWIVIGLLLTLGMSSIGIWLIKYQFPVHNSLNSENKIN
jgi:CheY-like chemotaxis protein